MPADPVSPATPAPVRPRSRTAVALALCLLAAPAGAQSTETDATQPMSAIDWLSDSVAAPAPPVIVPLGPGGDEPPLVGEGAFGAETWTPTLGALPAVTVAPLDSIGTGVDSIGILAPAITGLPAGLWGAASPTDVARRIRAERPEMLPALQALLQTILLAELDPPRGAGGNESAVFFARVDKLLEMGALEPANALLERAPADNTEVFRRHFDVALLLGEEQPLCEKLSQSPQLSPTYQARIFCLARAGDWSGASLLLGTGTALGLIGEADADLFARFLDPDLFEDQPPLEVPLQPTPLTFRMYEAIGQAIPTQGLPLAFAHSDLRPNIGWKARIEAGERLARTGAVTDNQLYGLYSERQPAASGGVWDRVAALQSVEAALQTGATDKAAAAVERLWGELSAARVEVPISRVLGPDLARLGLDGEAGRIALHMALLSDDYEAQAVAAAPDDPRDALLTAIARGLVAAPAPGDEAARSVVEGFAAAGPPARLAALVEEDRLGEAILRAITLLAEGTSGDLDQVTDALALLRSVGLEDTARRTALEFLILDRRG